MEAIKKQEPAGDRQRHNLTAQKKTNMKINNPIKKLIESYSRKQREDSIAQVTHSIQLREFENKIWLCYNNIPLVEQDDLKHSLCEAVYRTRDALCRYYNLAD